ncbi:MAG: hypothetical protein WBD99_13415 [Thermodesulfobacteriota bacterium]
MESAHKLVIWLILTLTLKTSYSAPEPYIVHVSDTPLGYTMVISGGNYDPKTVKVIVHFPGAALNSRKELPHIIRRLVKGTSLGETGLHILVLRISDLRNR